MPFIRTELTERAPAFFDLPDITISINSVFSVRQFFAQSEQRTQRVLCMWFILCSNKERSDYLPYIFNLC